MKKGVVPALAILGILLVAVGAPGLAIAVDKISGKDIGPDNPIYGIERAGEALQKAFGMISDEELAAEREQEATYMEELAARYPERAAEYRQEAQNMRQEAQKFRTGATGAEPTRIPGR